jgi:Damage-control phosphatase ARMT1-like domain
MPPELLSNDPATFAWGVLHERTPKVVAQVRDAHPYEPWQHRALDLLLEEITTGTMTLVDGPGWAEWGAGYFGRPWADVPFLWWESYFFWRLLSAVGFFEPGPWYRVDPFESFKAAELDGAELAADLAALERVFSLPDREQGEAKLVAALWGNQADLAFRVSSEASRSGGAGRLVADDSAGLWRRLSATPPGTVGLVTDNSGRELTADLILVDHLLEAGLAARVVLHVKPRPYYISDATTADVIASLRRLAAAPGQAARVAGRLWAAMGDGRVALATHEFFCAPWSYHRMPEDLAEEFGSMALTVFKGDLNYRRLVGDRARPPSTPFADAVSYFPGPVAALRTLKSEVVTGVDESLVADLPPSWRTDGGHGLVQFRP